MEKERENLNFQSQNSEKYNLPFKLSELKNSLDKSHDTTAGPDDIHYQILKHIPSDALETLLNIMNEIWRTGVRSAMLHASETWPVTKPCLQRLQRNDRAMIRQICNVKPQDTATIRSIELLARLGIEDLDIILKERRLRWYGHVERSNGAVKTAFDIQVNGKRGPGRPKMTWKQLTERDRREWKLSAIDPHDRDTWRSGVRSAMRAASQLPGRGPTVVDMAPIPAR